MAEENTPEKPATYPYPFFVGENRGSSFKVGEGFTSFALFTSIVPVKWNSAGLVSCIIHAFFVFFGFIRERLRLEKMGVKGWV